MNYRRNELDSVSCMRLIAAIEVFQKYIAVNTAERNLNCQLLHFDMLSPLRSAPNILLVVETRR